MTKIKDVTVVLVEHCADGANVGGIQAGHSNEAENVPSTSFMFMDAANNVNVQNFTLDNIRQYTLQKFNKDVTKNIFDNQKPITRSQIRAEEMRIDASKQTKVKCKQKDSTKAKRKLEPSLGSPIAETKKKNIARKKIPPALLEDQELPIVQEEAGDNVINAETESKMKKTKQTKTKGSSRKILKNASSKCFPTSSSKSKSQVDGIKENSVDHVNIPFSSLYKTESQHVQEKQDGEIADNSEKESKLEAVKAKGRSKKNVKNTIISSKKVKSKSKIDGTKKKSVDRVNIPSSLEKAESQHIQEEQVGDNTVNPENECKTREVVKSKGKGRSKKNLKKTVVYGKKKKTKKA